jgi:hypothetical protein
MSRDYTASNNLRWISEEYYGGSSYTSHSQISTYKFLDLNGGHIEILQQPPTALEFSRLMHISRPVIIRGKVYL